MSTILIGLEPDQVSQKHKTCIAELAEQYQVVYTTDREIIENLLDDIEVAAARFPRELVFSAPALRWYQQWGAGADWLMQHPEAENENVIITNVSGLHAIPISEHILAMLLAFARRLPDAWRAKKEHRWFREEVEGVFELAGKTMVLIGVGAIGERTAELADAHGIRVIGIRRNPEEPASGVTIMDGPENLRRWLPEGDFVVLTVPLTHETRQMIGAEELAAMKKSTLIVNIGRGGTIDQEALIQALRDGTIAGAGLDVFEKEPLPQDSPLWDLDNVILTPHYAGRTPEYNRRGMDIFVENLERYVSDKPLFNIVDPSLGY